MTRYKDFDAARAETIGDALTFTLGGTDFTCKPVIPAGAVLQLAAASSEDGPRAAIVFGEFLRECLREEDQSMLGDVLGLVGLTDLFAVAQWILEETTNRPLSSVSVSDSPRSMAGTASSNGSSAPASSPTP